MKDNPDFFNNYFAGIAEKTCDFNKIRYPDLDDNVEVRFEFEPPDLDDL